MEDHQLLGSLTADIIRERFPGRIVLTPEEVAVVMKRKPTRGTVQGIRERLKSGTLIPGLKRQGGRWEVPVAALVNAIDGMTRSDIESRPALHPRAVPRHGRPIGPRWTDIFAADAGFKH
jgi:hypothetical protein